MLPRILVHMNIFVHRPTYFLSLRCCRFFLNAFLTRNRTKAARSNCIREKENYVKINPRWSRFSSSIHHLSNVRWTRSPTHIDLKANVINEKSDILMVCLYLALQTIYAGFLSRTVEGEWKVNLRSTNADKLQHFVIVTTTNNELC